MTLTLRLLGAVLLVLGAAAQEAADVCPAEADILPCRCEINNRDLQIWCSNSDLPKVLAGLRAVGTHVKRPIDELILEHNALPSLPGGAFANLKVVRLMLRENGLERVAATWLSGLEESLLELFVVESSLRSLPPESLEALRHLEAVTLQAGAVKRMPRFSEHPRLRYIQLQSPALAELAPNAFKALPELEELHVTSSPRLSRLEAGLLSELPRLRVVNVSQCGLAWLHPRALSRLPALTEVSMVGNLLADAGMVGRAMRELPALEVLRLDDNMLERLAEASFVDLRTLQEIHLGGNRITELHRGAFHLVPALRKIDLSHNRVYRVHPEAFIQRSDSGLEELWLMHNELDHVAELRALLESLPRLRYLDVSHNFIQEIPFGALHGHPTLERLHLDHNRIQHVQREAFMAMPALRELRLKNNSLSTLMDGPMWNLPGLKGLDLSHNVFRRLDPRMLANLPSLRRLDMSGNALSSVDADAFLATPALEHVNLSGNALISLHPATFSHLEGLYELDVGVNQLREVVPGLPRGVEYLRMPRNQVTSLPATSTPDLKLPALKLLDLSSNGINRVPVNCMNSLTQLKTLNLAENAVQQLEDGSLNGLSQLEVLDLHDNRLLRIHGRALRDTRHLRELDLHSNRIDTLQPELLLSATRLQRLDVSRNQLASIPTASLANNRDLEAFDASRNGLTEFPEALRGMAKLTSLDLSHNRLKQLAPDTLHTLTALSELRLAKNKFQELPEDMFRDLPNLTLLDLDSNELEKMATRAVRDLPNLRAIRLSHNRLASLPSGAFSELPELLSAELQENQLTGVAADAFLATPRLALMNLSYNQLDGLEQAGMGALRSLEVLDLSHNKMKRLAGSALAGMDALVELKIDDNRICGVHGAPFAGLSRLRVVSLRNNRIASLSEPAFAAVRATASLDVAGNPLSCSCGMLWLQTWMRETHHELGPRCADGTLLKEVRLSRQNCDARRDAQAVAPGCESEALTSIPGQGTSQVISTWMEIKDGTTASSLTPEESEYFYDEYVEYPLEDVNGTHANRTLHSSTPIPVAVTTATPTFASGASSHYVSGDTPTLYAGVRHDRNKTVVTPPTPPTPPRSGLTFFGIPLPSINIGGLWGTGGAGRKADGKTAEVRFVGPRGKVQMLPPKMQSGFMPMGVETGGFMPIVDPALKEMNQSRGSHLSAERQLRYNFSSWDSQRDDDKQEPGTSGESDTHRGVIEMVPGVNRIGEPRQNAPVSAPRPSAPVSQPVGPPAVGATRAPSTTTASPFQDLIETDGTAPDPTLDPSSLESNAIPGESSTPLSVQATTRGERWGVAGDWFGAAKTSTEASAPATTRPPPVAAAESTTVASTSLLGDLWGMISASGSKNAAQSPSSLSALLVPGGQLPQFKPPGGKPTVTKVTPVLEEGPVPMEEFLRRTQTNTNSRSISERPNIIADTAKPAKNETMDWYFKNYNKTNLEPYVGPGKRAVGRNAAATHAISVLMAVVLPLIGQTLARV